MVTTSSVWDLFYFTILCVSIVSSAVILGLLIYSHHISENAIPSKGCILSLSYAVIIMYITFALATISSRLYDYDVRMLVLLNQIGSICWIAAQCFIYSLLLLRIHLTFIGTKYAVSRIVFALFVLCTACFMSCGALYVHSKIIVDHQSHVHLAWKYGTAYSVGMSISSFCVCSLLITLFVSKMMTVTVDMHCDRNEVMMDRQARERMNTKQRLLLNISSKCFVLSFIAMIWTQIAVILMAVSWLTGCWSVICVWRMFMYSDGIVDPICLFLIFECNDRWYQCLCHGVHAFARLLFRACTERRAEQHLEKKKSLVLKRHLLEQHTTGSDFFGPGCANTPSCSTPTA